MNEAISEIQELTTPFKISKGWLGPISGYLEYPIKCYLSPALLGQNGIFFADNKNDGKIFSMVKNNGVYLWLIRLKNGGFRIVYVGRSCGRTTDMMIRVREHFKNARNSHVDCIVHIVEENKLLCIEGCDRATRTNICVATDSEASEYLKKIHVLFLPIPFPDSVDVREIREHKNVIHELEGSLIAVAINHVNEIIDSNYDYRYIMNTKGKAFNYFKRYGNDGNLPQIYEAIEKCWKSSSPVF
jgi:hypothetical protein